MSTPKQVSIISEPRKQKGQKHRSSENFTLADFPSKCELTVNVYTDYDKDPSTVTSDKITFDIKADKTGGDPVLAKGLKNGSTFSVPDHRNLYIADPKDTDYKFKVVFTQPEE